MPKGSWCVSRLRDERLKAAVVMTLPVRSGGAEMLKHGPTPETAAGQEPNVGSNEGERAGG